MSRYNFKLAGADEATAAANFVADFNAFLVANGFIDGQGKTLQITAATLAGTVDIVNGVRMDFSGPFGNVVSQDANGVALVTPYDKGQHLNVMIDAMPNAPAGIDVLLAVIDAKIAAWYGAAQSGTAYPVCPGLTSFTNPPATGWPSSGGQVWPSTPAGTVLINGLIANPVRMWV